MLNRREAVAGINGWVHMCMVVQLFHNRYPINMLMNMQTRSQGLSLFLRQ